MKMWPSNAITTELGERMGGIISLSQRYKPPTLDTVKMKRDSFFPVKISSQKYDEISHHSQAKT